MDFHVYRESDCLIVVDVQNDFCSGGALEVPDGDSVVPVINSLLQEFDHLLFTRDLHPPNHISFSSRPQFKDMSWPVHCVAGTAGADYHPILYVPDRAHVAGKATNENREAYSIFQDTHWAHKLRQLGIKRTVISGLATDFCVHNTVMDAISEGFDVWLVLDATRGIDIPKGAVDKSLADMKNAGAKLILSEKIYHTEN